MGGAAITPPQGGDTKFQSVCLDFDTKGIPVVGYLGTNLEFGKCLMNNHFMQPSFPHPSSGCKRPVSGIPNQVRNDRLTGIKTY